MLSVQNLTVSFGSLDLLNDISFLVNEQDRIGLTGKNGAGKTTLLKVIAGILSPTKGRVDRPKELTIGYLPQQMSVSDSTTVMNETLTAFSGLISLSEEIERCSAEIAQRKDYHSREYLELCDRLSETEEKYRILGGGNYLADTELTLAGLGFERKDFTRPTRELSGGWRMRIELAKLILRKPSLILLDEPTNHLDIESIQWLETFLSGYPGAVMLVSHDRAFLDNVTNRTLEISLGKIYDYKVPWSEYVILREERRTQQIASFRNQQKMIEDTERFIERFRYKATKAIQVQSKIKQLDKLERIEVDEEDNSVMNLRFPPAPRSGTVVVEARNLSKSFGIHHVLNKVSIVITRGEKVAFVGRNGEGKTTFSRVITGELDYEGSLKIGHNVKIGYFAQNQDELLDESITVLETIDNVAKGDIRTKIRDMLGAFLFGGDDVDKKVKVLSGGERSRLALVKLLLEPCNLLVLDEPTNHLDMRSKDILKQALMSYDGTLIVVSHDRDFLDGLVTKVFEFRHNRIREHLGGIYDFLRNKKIASLREIERKDRAKVDAVKEDASSNKQKYLEKKEYERSLRKLRRKLEDSEKRIGEMEAELSEIYKKLMDNPDPADSEALYLKHEELKKELDEEMNNWTDYSYEVEEFEKTSDEDGISEN
ncbi:MAG TPA: ABC-F family ATP-binding cassette domain-containing protein [Bacteroidales bacterium]|jgi:ATP-binding cassette subfamily F protein 3|nr:ATP-binding cassette domain-containing protein [Bacteroidales bacterium]HNY52127.1 ABC-F family ATP-binding cassette domain-containing protein [Bacteroidales bacterium]HOG55724.1 ABC-F family ATP-binding cassette domain-containing protein [Bacteroidales bacterium]HPB12305.1 ABC-F family ATP-binding cassette domain-containing protein [Bacteroidales bacterium]HPV16310.1 ABC-F family ATP-binding cassette domain-containing protein [Bacteroidales bacterium]